MHHFRVRRRLLVSTFVLVSLVLAGRMTAAGQPSLAGYWEGAIEVLGARLGITVSLEQAGGAWKGTIDIPQQGAKALPLTNVRFDAPAVHFELPAGPGLAVFDGKLEGDTVSGTFEQAGIKGTFQVKRGQAPSPAPPEPPPPYREEEVTLKGDSVTLACTLTLPEGKGPFPAAGMITGSGPQNRDEEIFGFKPFRLIADHLTRKGIVVLRCDDRGIGGSRGNVSEATSSDLADDALAQVSWLAAHPDVDRNRIGLIGHSEGGIIAPMAALRSDDVKFLVLLAAPAVTGERIMLAQAELLAGAEGASEEAIAKNRQLQLQTFEAVRTGKGWNELAAAMRRVVEESIAQLPEAQRKAMKDPESLAATQVESQLRMARSPWLKFFLDYDPAPALAKVNVPVLAVFGELDLQTPLDLNLKPMEQALAKNPRHQVEVIPRANHLYQEAKTGGVSEYPVLEKKFAPGLLDLLSTWILGLKEAGPRSGA